MASQPLGGRQTALTGRTASVGQARQNLASATVPRHKSPNPVQEGAAMTWVRTHWVAIAVSAVLFFVGVAVGTTGQTQKRLP
jgi:hypothetical protein